ncbi:hypothetical protein IMSHALPRED_006185 [Imshaugia aleurites]|uniref:Uncharacterized protein n=1 Tax=Imshaugia aleurites TaxID=172621 RepID=A0A8H3IKN6_9LECA|nr:hypothetical protein IMSHALPRED_006185 [Imshaugia aleurites]
MRASALCCLLSYLASSALALRHPHHKHRHNKEKRTEVLVVEEDLTVEDVDVTIYLPGPPPEGYERFQEGREKEQDHDEYPLSTYTLPDGSATVVSGPEPTSSGSGYSASEAPSSNPIATSSAAGDSDSESGSSLLSGGGGDIATSASLPASSSVAADPPAATSSPVSSVIPVNNSPASTAASPAIPANDKIPANDSPASTAASSAIPTNDSPATTAASSAAAPSHTGAYPFSALVAFGDNLSDNGNGSVAHNVAAWSPTNIAPGNTVYGFGTWTDGPVAVSYLTDLLGVPMNQDFAFGHAWGGANFGATIDDTMTQSNFSASLADGPWFDQGQFSSPCWGAPSAKVQITDYIRGGVDKHALHFLWIGNNDISVAYEGIWGGNIAVDNPTLNADFATNISTKIPDLVTTLLAAGAPYVFVANLYPANLAPLLPNFLAVNTTAEWAALGAAIAGANTALEAALKALPGADQVIYYDAYTFLSDLYNDPGDDAFPNIRDTNGWPSFCDGDKEETEYVLSINGTVVDGVEITDNWDYCFTLKHGDEWYWMEYRDPTSYVHQLVAQDMAKTVKGFSFPSS